VRTQRPGLVLAVSSLAAFLAFLDVTIVNIAFPAITAAFPATSAADLSWIFTAYNVTFAALLVPAGRLADLWGRRRTFLTGLALFGLASAACAAAPSVGALVAARAVQAVAAALLAPSSLALLLPAFPPERRGFALGTWGAMGGIAAATGPALGGLLVDALGWRAVFLVNLPVVVVTLAAGALVMTESRDRTSRLPDPLGVLLLGAGVALLAWGIVGGETSWTAPSTVARLVGGLALLGGFAWRSGRVATPLVEPALFRVRAFRASVVGYLVFSAAFYALLLANVLFLTGVWHYDVLRAGLAVTPGPLMAAVASALGGRLTDRFGARAVIVPGALLFAAGCALFVVGIGAEPSYLLHFLPATLLTGTGVGAVFSGLGVAAVAALPANRYATGSAVGTCARQIGAVLGISALLSGLAAGVDFHSAWTLMAIAACATAVIGYTVGLVKAASAAREPIPVRPITPVGDSV
jgi:EmrB/QacA subfamily drug resistance transporter